MLALASATGGRRAATQEDLLGGVAVELVHLASLYHDDVIDEATVRRNVESVNSRFGNLVAIVAGDYLLARSAAIAAGLGTEIAGLLATTLASCARGRWPRCAPPSRPAAPRRTTSPHRRQDRRTHGLLVPHRRAHRRPAAHRGRCLHDLRAVPGMVFQLRDDVLDIVAVEGELGKPAGQDLAEGIYTLPVLLALEDPDVGRELGPLLGHPLGQPERDKAREIVAGSTPSPRPSPSARLRHPGDRGHRRARLARALDRGSATSPTRSSSTSRLRPGPDALRPGGCRAGDCEVSSGAQLVAVRS